MKYRDYASDDPVKADIAQVLPPRVRQAVLSMDRALRESLCELRIRRNQPLMGLGAGVDFYITENGSVTRPMPERPLILDDQEWRTLLQLITQNSIYALEQELRMGYVTLRGGHRVGLIGRAVLESGMIRTQRDISSFCIRVARQIIGIADMIMGHVVRAGRPRSALIVSPPSTGKTTLLRDIARQLSTGMPALGFSGCKVGVVDERSEIAACVAGIPQNDLGPRTDVLDACPKAEGMAILVRTMSPQVIVTDEIGLAEDSLAIEDARRSGVEVVATAHGYSLEEVVSRSGISGLVKSAVFHRAIILGNSLGIGTCEAVIGLGDGKPIVDRPFKLEPMG